MSKSKPSSINPSQRRIKKIQKKSPVSIAEQKKYANYLKEEKKLEEEKEKVEIRMEKELEKAKKLCGIDKLELKIQALQEKIDAIADERYRFEDLAIKFLQEGGKLAGFILKSIGKRFNVSYMSICKEFFGNDHAAFKAAKEKHGSRKEDFILIYEGEEVSRQSKAA
jgi:hypothetical protein